MLGDPATAFVLKAQELVVIHATAEQAALPDGVRMTLATFFEQSGEMLAETREWGLHHLFSRGRATA